MSGVLGKVPQLQKAVATAPGYIHMKLGSDKLTSVLIPTAFAVVGGASVVKGLYGMYTGTGKLD